MKFKEKYTASARNYTLATWEAITAGDLELAAKYRQRASNALKVLRMVESGQ